MEANFEFLKLPLELRCLIYSHLCLKEVVPAPRHWIEYASRLEAYPSPIGLGHKPPRFDLQYQLYKQDHSDADTSVNPYAGYLEPAILRVSKQIHDEAEDVFYDRLTFQLAVYPPWGQPPWWCHTLFCFLGRAVRGTIEDLSLFGIIQKVRHLDLKLYLCDSTSTMFFSNHQDDLYQMNASSSRSKLRMQTLQINFEFLQPFDLGVETTTEAFSPRLEDVNWTDEDWHSCVLQAMILLEPFHFLRHLRRAQLGYILCQDNQTAAKLGGWWPITGRGGELKQDLEELMTSDAPANDLDAMIRFYSSIAGFEPRMFSTAREEGDLDWMLAEAYRRVAAKVRNRSENRDEQEIFDSVAELINLGRLSLTCRNYCRRAYSLKRMRASRRCRNESDSDESDSDDLDDGGDEIWHQVVAGKLDKNSWLFETLKPYFPVDS